MSKCMLRWLLPATCTVVLAALGCDTGTPATDETDPLPRVFNNEELDPQVLTSQPTPGPMMGGGMGKGGRGYQPGGARPGGGNHDGNVERPRNDRPATGPEKPADKPVSPKVSDGEQDPVSEPKKPESEPAAAGAADQQKDERDEREKL